MKTPISIVFLLFIFSHKVYAQGVAGYVQDQKGNPVFGAVIQGVSDSYNILGFASTNQEGKFTLKASNYSYIITSHINYRNDTLKISINTKKPYSIVLVEKLSVLDEFVVVENKKTYRNNEDTTVYHAATFMDGHDKNLEDVLKKLPGVKVDDNGNIVFRGKVVSEVLIENDNLFGQKYAVGTKSMKPVYVEEFEFIDNYNEEELTADLVKTDKLVLNLKLKEKYKLSVFGDADAGLGAPQKYLARANLFHLARQYKGAIFGNLNNVAYEQFNLLDYLQNGQEFDDLSYNRSINRVTSRGLIPIAGLPYELQAYSNNKYLTANEIIRKGRLRSELRLTGSLVKNNFYDRRSLSYLMQDNFFDQSYHDSLHYKGISLFNETVYKIDKQSKVKIRTELIFDDNKGISHQQISNGIASSGLSYLTPSKRHSTRANLEYLRKIKPALALSFNYSFIEENIHESARSTAQPEGSSSLTYENYHQQVKQAIMDHAVEFSVLEAKEKRKSQYRAGVYFKEDDIAANYSFQTESNSPWNGFSRQYAEPFIASNHQLLFGRTSLLLKSKLSTTTLQKKGNFSDQLLYDLSAGIKSSLSTRMIVNSYIGHRYSLLDALAVSDVTYFSSFNSLLASGTGVDRARSTMALIGFVFSEPKKLMEVKGTFYCSLRSLPINTTEIEGFQTKNEYSGVIRQPNISSNLNADKYIRAIRSNLSVDASYFWLRSKNHYRIYNTFVTHNKSIGLTLTTNTLRFIAVNLGHHFQAQEVISSGKSGIAAERVNKYLKAQYGIKLYPLPKHDLQIDIRSDIYASIDSFNFTDNHFINLSVSYNLGSQSNLSIAWKNVLNKRMYSNIIISPLTVETINPQLQPSFAYITYSKKFSL